MKEDKTCPLKSSLDNSVYVFGVDDLAHIPITPAKDRLQRWFVLNHCGLISVNRGVEMHQQTNFTHLLALYSAP
jgi:hypothetical protein